MATAIVLTCDECGKLFERRKGKENPNSEHHFCCTSCAGQWRSKNIGRGANHPLYKSRAIFQCEWCGIEFEKLESRTANHVFCSRQCMGKWSWAKGNLGPPEPRYGKDNPKYKPKVCVKCAVCGKTFERFPSHANRLGQTLCSYDCRSVWYSKHYSGKNSPQWRGGSSRKRLDYGSAWPAARQAALERDNYQCVICGSVKRLNVHHVMSFGRYGFVSHNVDNLIVLCADHHLLGRDSVHKVGRETWVKKHNLRAILRRAEIAVRA